MVNYKLLTIAPYNLSTQQVKWVKNTINEMTLEEKIGQIFCLIAYDDSEETMHNIIHKYKAGAIMGRPMPLKQVCEVTSYMHNESKIPLLFAANLEAGGDGLIEEGTNVGANIQIGATGNVDFAYKQGQISARECQACGGNWAFAPVIDIGANFRNPIVATRVYGSDADLVAKCGVAYTKGAQEQGIAVSIKHFPGDGVDERDQHLVTSINTLSIEEWDASYGVVYKSCIDAGALTLMAGHIMMPEYSRKLCPGIKDEDIMPAPLSPELLNGLLRSRLGFNGMIVSDSTTMHGMNISMPRKKAVPYSIAAGCDMFLFTKNQDEDFQFMLDGINEGIITHERLDEAVMRILGVKQALGLIEKKKNGKLIPDVEQATKIVGCTEHKVAELECTNNSITLVKNLDKLLPLNPQQYKRVLLYPIDMGEGFFEDCANIEKYLKPTLEQEGFEVDVFKETGGLEGFLAPTTAILDNYDLIIYASNLESKSNQTTVRIEWAQPMGANVPIYMQSIPTIFISFANPYHLIDVPRIRTFINAYKLKPLNVQAVVDKIVGKSEFKGRNPVDPFCGMWDTKL